MKVLWKKFKKTKLSIRLVYILVLFLFLISYGMFFRSLLLLKGIETPLRITVLIILFLLLILYWFSCLILLLMKKHKTVIGISFIVMIISCILLIGSLAINKVYGLLDNVNKETIIYTTNLISLNDTKFDNSSSFVVGMINNETDVEGNILAYELIEKENLKVKVEKFDTYFEMLEKLYNGELNGVFITSEYIVMYEGYDAYENIANDVKVLFEYSKEMKNQDTIESLGNASVTDPFTLLIMGVDSTSDKLNANAAFNGDTLMLITFNPHTLNATVFSIPRDTYVPIACINSSSKINSSAAYGTQCVINTVQNLTGINIDYYLKINFKGVVDLVDAVGGIDITVPEKIDFCEQDSHRSFAPQDLQCIKSGYQHMNGEQALAFSRHRHTLPAGDFQRVQHQQLVVEALANAAKGLSSINDFYKVLDAISANLNTNMTTTEMLSLYNVGKNILLNTTTDGTMINIEKTYLTGYDLTMYVDNLRSRVYTFQYYPESLKEITDSMKVNLELKNPTLTKTFNFSVNEPYEIAIIGKKYYTVQRNETIPDFTAKQLSYVQTWCEARNIVVSVNYISEGSSGFDESLPDGYVTSQSVIKGKLVSGINSITVNVIKKNSTSTSDNNNSSVTTTTSNKVTTSSITTLTPGDPTDGEEITTKVTTTTEKVTTTSNNEE